jgi:hypothetical protein
VVVEPEEDKGDEVFDVKTIKFHKGFYAVA